MALDPQDEVVRLLAGKDFDADVEPVAHGERLASPIPSLTSHATSGLPSPTCSAVRFHFSSGNAGRMLIGA
jgi:hypothetical protein